MIWENNEKMMYCLVINFGNTGSLHKKWINKENQLDPS